MSKKQSCANADQDANDGHHRDRQSTGWETANSKGGTVEFVVRQKRRGQEVPHRLSKRTAQAKVPKSPERLHHPADRRRLPVLHLHPLLRPTCL